MQQRRVNRGNKSGNYNLPAPIGGLNACDSLDLMAETDAIVMDNYIPGETKVALRKGFTRYVTTGTPIRTLVEFKAESGNNQFFAFDDNSVWDITSAAAPQKVEGREYKNGQWQTTQFKNRLFAVNGEDAPQTCIASPFYIALLTVSYHYCVPLIEPSFFYDHVEESLIRLLNTHLGRYEYSLVILSCTGSVDSSMLRLCNPVGDNIEVMLGI